MCICVLGEDDTWTRFIEFPSYLVFALGFLHFIILPTPFGSIHSKARSIFKSSRQPSIPIVFLPTQSCNTDNRTGMKKPILHQREPAYRPLFALEIALDAPDVFNTVPSVVDVVTALSLAMQSQPNCPGRGFSTETYLSIPPFPVAIGTSLNSWVISWAVIVGSISISIVWAFGPWGGS